MRKQDAMLRLRFPKTFHKHYYKEVTTPVMIILLRFILFPLIPPPHFLTDVHHDRNIVFKDSSWTTRIALSCAWICWMVTRKEWVTTYRSSRSFKLELVVVVIFSIVKITWGKGEVHWNRTCLSAIRSRLPPSQSSEYKGRPPNNKSHYDLCRKHSHVLGQELDSCVSVPRTGRAKVDVDGRLQSRPAVQWRIMVCTM